MIEWISSRFNPRERILMGAVLFLFGLVVGSCVMAEYAYASELEDVGEYETVVESTEVDGETDGAFDALETVLSDYDTRLSAVEEVVMPLADYDVYDGSISTTYVTYFAGLVEKLGPEVDYVLFRSGQYKYVFAYGDLEIASRVISGNGVSCVYIDTNYNTTVSYGSEASFSVDLGNEMAYSNLGDYPVLQQGVKSYENKALIVAVCVLFLYVVCRDIFKAVRRIG